MKTPSEDLELVAVKDRSFRIGGQGIPITVRYGDRFVVKGHNHGVVRIGRKGIVARLENPLSRELALPESDFSELFQTATSSAS